MSDEEGQDVAAAGASESVRPFRGSVRVADAPLIA